MPASRSPRPRFAGGRGWQAAESRAGDHFLEASFLEPTDRSMAASCHSRRLELGWGSAPFKLCGALGRCCSGACIATSRRRRSAACTRSSATMAWSIAAESSDTRLRATTRPVQASSHRAARPARYRFGMTVHSLPRPGWALGKAAIELGPAFCRQSIRCPPMKLTPRRAPAPLAFLWIRNVLCSFAVIACVKANERRWFLTARLRSPRTLMRGGIDA